MAKKKIFWALPTRNSIHSVVLRTEATDRLVPHSYDERCNLQRNDPAWFVGEHRQIFRRDEAALIPSAPPPPPPTGGAARLFAAASSLNRAASSSGITIRCCRCLKALRRWDN